MSKKRRRPKERMVDVFRTSFSLSPALDAAQPLIHINCHGSVEIENCSHVVEYGPNRIRMHMKEGDVTVEGEELTILSLNAHVTEIRGRIFRLSLMEGTP